MYSVVVLVLFTNYYFLNFINDSHKILILAGLSLQNTYISTIKEHLEKLGEELYCYCSEVR